MSAAKPPKKLLIVLLGAIGDVVRALPLACRIRKYWPAVEIHWAVEPISYPLLENHFALDKIMVFDRPRGLPAFLTFVRRLRKEKYELVLDLQRHFKSGISSLSTCAPARIGFACANARELNCCFNNLHIAPVEKLSSKILHFQKFGDLLGLPASQPLEFGLSPSLEEQAEVSRLIAEACKAASIELPPVEKRLALILGSTWESRFWSVEHYASLIGEAKQRWGLVPLLVGGRRERAFAAALADLCTGLPLINLVEKTRLRSLTAVFQQVRLALGSDSGPMHIASALACPVISLWGSTGALRSAPYGSEHLVLQSPIGCSPCYRKKCPGLDTLCMSEIHPAMALELIAKVLEAPPLD